MQSIRYSRRHTEAFGGRDQRDLVSRAYTELRTLIVRGRLAPGSRIIESDLAQRLGVSRTPVRSALQRLLQEGFVTSLEGGKNARLLVAPLTAGDCREVLSLLGAVEGIAARLAAALPDAPRHALAADLAAINDRFEELVASEITEPELLFQLHTRFHTVHVEAAGSPRVRALHDSVSPQAERYRRVYSIAAPRGVVHEVEEHREIIAAIEAGDPVRAQLAVQDNWARGAERLSQVVDRIGERGNW